MARRAEVELRELLRRELVGEGADENENDENENDEEDTSERLSVAVDRAVLSQAAAAARQRSVMGQEMLGLNLHGNLLAAATSGWGPRSTYYYCCYYTNGKQTAHPHAAAASPERVCVSAVSAVRA